MGRDSLAILGKLLGSSAERLPKKVQHKDVVRGPLWVLPALTAGADIWIVGHALQMESICHLLFLCVPIFMFLL